MKKTNFYDGSGNLLGKATFMLDNRGKTQMVGYTPKKTDYAFLKELLLEHFEESEIIADKVFEGYRVQPKGSDWTWLTAYVAQGRRRYSLYIALPDIWEGIDIEDEKEVVSKGLPGDIRGAIESLVAQIDKPEEDYSGKDLLDIFASDYDEQ